MLKTFVLLFARRVTKLSSTGINGISALDLRNTVSEAILFPGGSAVLVDILPVYF
jgi:hypothetical protein